MGFFRKLFGGDEEKEAPPEAETAAAAPEPESQVAPPDMTADPYRGAVLVEEPVEEPVEITKNAKAMWHWRSRVLCIELGVRLPLRSMVYTGKPNRNTDVVRRITFGDDGYRVDWEHQAIVDGIEGWIVRVDDRIVIPGPTGVRAVHIVTGELCWELPHPAKLAKQPVRHRGGGMFLLFADQRWMRLDARDGSTLSEGTVKNDRESRELLEQCSEIGRAEESTVIYGGRRVGSSGNAISVGERGRASDGEPRGPSAGEYPLEDGWEPTGWMTLAGGKLATRLDRAFAERRSAAVGLFDATSLEPLQLLELGEVDSGGDCWVVDDVLLVDVDLKTGGSEEDVMFVVDPHAERVIAFFDEDGRDGYLFDRKGARIWTKPL